MKIGDFEVKTQYVYPAIPMRTFDWCAYVDGQEEDSRFVAHGETELDSLVNLRNQLLEADILDDSKFTYYQEYEWEVTE